jgi:hypothetical protein
MFCTCGRWVRFIGDDSELHFTISEYLPRCPFRRWWNAWRHRTLTNWSPEGA